MNLQTLTRWKAFALHLVLSALVAGVVVGLVVFLWYPPPFFAAMGGAVLLRLLIGVDVVLGPLITLVVFDPAKPGLKFDLATIVVLQMAALAYGGYVMFDARPVYNVFVKDRFETIAANAVDEASVARAQPEYRQLSMVGPRVVAANQPANADEALTLAMGVMRGGPDVAELPHLYAPYAQEAARAGRAARSLVELSRQSKESSDTVSDFVASHGNGQRNLGYLPARARNRDFAVVVDRKTGEIVGYLALHPW